MSPKPATPPPLTLTQGLVGRDELLNSLKQQLIEEASLSFAKACDMAQEGEIRRQVAIALFGLARIAALQGDMQEAECQGKKSEIILEELGDEKKRQVAQWLHGIDP